MKLFKVLSSYTGFPKDCPLTIPWDALNEEWAMKNHGQTLEHLDSRGGLSPAEIWSNVNHKPLAQIVEGQIWRPSQADGVALVKSLQPKSDV